MIIRYVLLALACFAYARHVHSNYETRKQYKHLLTNLLDRIEKRLDEANDPEIERRSLLRRLDENLEKDRRFLGEAEYNNNDDDDDARSFVSLPIHDDDDDDDLEDDDVDENLNEIEEPNDNLKFHDGNSIGTKYFAAESKKEDLEDSSRSKWHSDKPTGGSSIKQTETRTLRMPNVSPQKVGRC